MLINFLNVDVMIVVVYLLLTLYIGIKSSKKITTFKEYAIGDGTFTTPVLTATLLATLLGTENLMGMSEKVYSDGILWIFLFLGNSFCYFIIASFIASRIYKFHGCLSAAEIMSKINDDDKVTRIITASAGIFVSVGKLGAQIMAIGYLSQEFLDINPIIGILISAGIIILYSASGGIKAVTYTDVLQFVFLIVAVPIVSYFVFSKAGGMEAIVNLADTVKYKDHFSIISDKYSLWSVISLIILFYIPGISPVTVQRILMANGDIRKATNSIKATALTFLPFHIMIGIIGLSAIIIFPNIQADLVFPTVVKELLPIGIKGLAIAGILAVAMSSADSYLNVSSILVINDIVKVVKPNFSDKVLMYLIKFLTVLLGIAAIIVAISFNNILDIVLIFGGFWYSTVKIPLFVGMLGIKASSKTFVYATSIGALISILWLIFPIEELTGFSSFGIAVSANALVFFTSRYFERANYPSEKVIVDKINTPSIFAKFPTNWSALIGMIRSSVSEEAQYVTFGIFIIATYIVPIFMWSQAGGTDDAYGISIYLRVIAGVLCSMLILSDKGREKYARYLPFYWLFTICFCLPFSTTFMFLENAGSPMWLVNLAISIFLLSTLTNWLSFIMLNAVGITAGYYFYLYIYGANSIVKFSGHQIYMMIYIILFSTLIGFIFKRNKEYLQQYIKNLLQKQVAEKTIEIRDINKQLEIKNAELVKQRDEINNQYIKIASQANDLKHALNVKERFLNNLSHEIRTPLHNLHSKTELILEGWKNIPEERKQLELAVIKESNNDLYKYVTGILDIAAFEAGDMEMEMKDCVELKQLIDSSLTNFTNKITKNNLIIEKNLEDIMIKNINKRKIIEVLCHILDNAVKYAKNKITINSILQNTYIKITITDDGMGVPNGEEEKIFEAFVESSQTATKAGGKGLGLALSKAVIVKHKGEIGVEKNNDNHSVFYITLPIAESAVNHPEHSSSKNKDITLTDKHMVIVDDNPNVLMSLELIMMSMGCTYKLFENAEEALAYILSNKVDIVITDYMMEPMNGMELAENIRKTDKLIPIILQSGIVSEERYKDKMSEVGINAFLTKPYTIDDVQNMIINVLTETTLRSRLK